MRGQGAGAAQLLGSPLCAAPSPVAPFEVAAGDERFLAEARLPDPSALDACHPQVVARLRSSCADMTEEEVAELGVSLFNRQASAEGRRAYPCTAGASLAACTTDMDPGTWNAYRTVSNRARAVCYAARQLRFRRRTEPTVDALASAAAGQLEAMRLLEDGQEELTEESLQRVARGQHDLLAEQERLRGSQEQMASSLRGNLEQLAQEEALIASGRQQVAQLIEGIARQMENMSIHLGEQDVELQEGHRAVLADLGRVQSRTRQVYTRIESDLALLQSYQSQAGLYYEELMGKLQRVNRSLGQALGAVEHLQSSVESRLQHIQSVLTWADTGVTMGAISTCTLHAAYFLLAALLVAFLQTPGLPRAALLVLVAANALAELQRAAPLGFPALAALLVLGITGHWLLTSVCHGAWRGQGQKPRLALLPPPQRAMGARDDLSSHRTSTPDSSVSPVGPKGEPLAAEGALGCAQLCDLASSPGREWETSLLEEELHQLEDTSYLPDGPYLEPDSLRPSPSSTAPGPGLGRAMSLRRVSLARSAWHEVLERRATPDKHCPGPGLSPASLLRCYSPNRPLASDASTSLLSPRSLCQGVTKARQPCRKKAVPGQDFCHVHAYGHVSHAS
ncbi:PREDICTED: protein brambleberry-like [Crocodylus porosus]|uniref:protein brambleberry-like n=1 Tax=Crocodylus porosus TaxID=8502 RepID=UPI0009393013|nr:PREDICTED: protein brambleberry-like [Crocodylus porosus]